MQIRSNSYYQRRRYISQAAPLVCDISRAFAARGSRRAKMLRRSVEALRRSGEASRIARQEKQVRILDSRCLSQLAGTRKVDAAASGRAGVLASLRQERNYKATGDFPSLPPLPPPVKVPKYVPGAHGKYATSLYISGYRAGILDRLESEMKELLKATSQSAEFKAFAQDIFIEKRDRVKIINDIFADSNLHEYTKNFLAILAEDNRLREFEKIATAFLDIMLAHKGCVKCVVTSAIGLSDAGIETVREKFITKLLRPGETANIEQKVDEDIIGGLIVEVGERMVDMSIARRIREIEKVLVASM